MPSNKESKTSKRSSLPTKALVYSPPLPKNRAERWLVRERAPIEFWQSDGQSLGLRGQALNISITGAGFLVDEPITRGTEVIVSFASRKKDLRPLRFRARIVWCSQLPISNHVIKATPPLAWHAGLIFLCDMTDEAAPQAHVKMIEQVIDALCR